MLASGTKHQLLHRLADAFHVHTLARDHHHAHAHAHAPAASVAAAASQAALEQPVQLAEEEPAARPAWTKRARRCGTASASDYEAEQPASTVSGKRAKF